MTTQEENYELRLRVNELENKLQYLLSNYIVSEEGLFCFPDGDTWSCKSKE